MDTNVIIAIVAIVVIAAILVIGGWWLGKTRKNAVDKSTEDAKAKADARLAAEAKSAAADSSTVKPSVDSNVDAAEKAPAESQQKSSAQASSSETAAPAPATEAKPEPVHETPESAGTRMQRLKARLSKSGNPVRQGSVQHSCEGSAFRSRLGRRRRHPSACRCWRGSQRTARRGTAQRRPNRRPVRSG